MGVGGKLKTVQRAKRLVPVDSEHKTKASVRDLAKREPDCTGTTTMTIAGVDASWHFVVLQGGEQIIFIATPSGDVWAGALTKE